MEGEDGAGYVIDFQSAIILDGESGQVKLSAIFNTVGLSGLALAA
jgi:hypothetical protein